LAKREKIDLKKKGGHLPKMGKIGLHKAVFSGKNSFQVHALEKWTYLKGEKKKTLPSRKKRGCLSKGSASFQAGKEEEDNRTDSTIEGACLNTPGGLTRSVRGREEVWVKRRKKVVHGREKTREGGGSHQ